MIDPGPPPDLDTVHEQRDVDTLVELFALTAADYLDRHSQIHEYKLRVKMIGTLDVESVQYDSVADLMSKPDFSVIAAATRGILNIFKQHTWSDRYSRLPILKTPSFSGRVVLFLCDYGLEFYEACTGIHYTKNILLCNSHFRGWTQR